VRDCHIVDREFGINFTCLVSLTGHLSESIFSGMAASVIHNSDYASVDEAKVAIDRYFADRNLHFQQNPKRAGKKIWGKERVNSTFKEGQNCKSPDYR
jgi:hypothetical protein